ncbi:ABC transporter permease [Thermosulfuriphilus sp.]
MSLKRILAVSLRQLFLYRRSLTRLLEVFYWPTVDLLLWGFVTLYLQESASRLPNFVSYFLGALILWNILYRAQQGIAVSFLEDIWARNLINLFVSPLRLSEYISGLLVISVIKTSLAFIIMSFLAGLIYSFDIFKLGLGLLPLVLNLVALGWAIGLATIGFILWFGQEAEILAWALAFIFLPLSAVFYPVDVLPPAIQTLSRLTPSAHAFEGMRTIINQGIFPWDHLLKAGALNIVYLSASLLFLGFIYKRALKKGTIPKIGE